MASVKRSLSRVNGVSRVDVSLEKAQATVIFDDVRTNPDALAKAVTSAGYPAKPKR